MSSGKEERFCYSARLMRDTSLARVLNTFLGAQKNRKTKSNARKELTSAF